MAPASTHKKSLAAGLLWTLWEKTLARHRRRVLFIETDAGRSFTGGALHEEIARHDELLRDFPPGARVAFCLPNGAAWIALFLALQKRALTAVPLDSGSPLPANLALAPHLPCSALFQDSRLHPIPGVPTKPSRDKTACIKVTSGTSSGLPKLVPCRAEHLVADGTNIIRTMGLRRGDRNLAVIPLGHSYGLGNLVLPLILQGTAIVSAACFVPHQLGEWIRLHRATVLPSVPAIFRVLAAMPGKEKLHPLRLAISAGAPLTAEIAQAFFQRYRLKIHNFYGSSETGGICYDRRGDSSLSGRSVGLPMKNVSVIVKRGAIDVVSAAVAKPCGRWRMPDHGEWNEKGELVLLGRRGQELNVGGKKVHPAEVEQALRAITGISDAIVWIAADSARPVLHTAVESCLTLADIQSALSRQLPEWKFPKRYLIRAEFPRTLRGKTDMATLRRAMDKSC
ncbi:MAG: acyl--CoA ligase [Methylacidiphilales bacterium]|nr:acyl--CoA ligase [Candidatus Methylacidiphilales bacterium]